MLDNPLNTPTAKTVPKKVQSGGSKFAVHFHTLFFVKVGVAVCAVPEKLLALQYLLSLHSESSSKLLNSLLPQRDSLRSLRLLTHHCRILF